MGKYDIKIWREIISDTSVCVCVYIYIYIYISLENKMSVTFILAFQVCSKGSVSEWAYYLHEYMNVTYYLYNTLIVTRFCVICSHKRISVV